MSYTLKLAAIASLALAAGNAAASLTTPSQGISSVLLAIEDNAIGSGNERHTFVLDLALGHDGLDYASFVNGTEGTYGRLSWDLSSYGAFSAYAPNSATFSWSVIGGYTRANGTGGAGGTPYNVNSQNAKFNVEAQWGALVTGHKDAGADFVNLDYRKINDNLGPTGKFGAWFTESNNAIGGSAENVADAQQYDDNTSLYDKWFANIGTLSASGTSAPHTNGEGNADFWWLTSTGTSTTAAVISKTFLGSFSLSNNVLTWTSANYTPVPVPGAVWLFGSALLGALGMSRRNSAI